MKADPRPGLTTLPDFLFPGPRLLIVGLNPGAHSVKVGHYYGRRSNRFWRLLHDSGLVPEPLTFEDDARLPALGIALTDLVKRSSSNIDAIAPAEWRAGAGRIVEIAETLSPTVIAFNGLAGYRHAFDRHAQRGLQPLALAGRPTFVMVSTSPRAGATFSYETLLGHWRELATAVAAGRDSRRDPA